MGILSALLGHASEADVDEVEQTLERILADDEKVERAFRLVRDLLIFTNRRFILVDRQGVTGKKSSYHSIPSRAITGSTPPTMIENRARAWITSSSVAMSMACCRSSALARK